ncbi:MAG: alanine/ornithine racemase family PLP-dependent enzyme [Chitinivibrionales bacterium]|nr:alanine/ornithine racemase family PLP-dependent enzyme [Chitinivibrionales bacterium]
MNRITINLEALYHNIKYIDNMMARRGSVWTLVTKVLCGDSSILEELKNLGIHSAGDTRLYNLKELKSVHPDCERWYLRVPHPSIVKDVAHLCHVSLNSETEIIEAINKEARAHNTKHRIIIMIELGDLREGILPGSLIKFYKRVFTLDHIEVIGIGSNLGCLSGTVPSLDQLMQLVLYHELLELKFKRQLPFISAGTSATLALLNMQDIPSKINHWRIGESVFLGTDLINRGTLSGLRDDVFTLEAEIAEIKHKSMQPLGEIADVAPFEPHPNEHEISPGQRGRRALITVGELDTDVRGLIPTNPSCRIVGASSDITVVHFDGENDADIGVGSHLSFKLNYSALLRLMNTRYVTKHIKPMNSSKFRDRHDVHHSPPNIARLSPVIKKDPVPQSTPVHSKGSKKNG